MNANINAVVGAAERADRHRPLPLAGEPFRSAIDYIMTADERDYVVDLATRNPFDPHAETGKFFGFLRHNLDRAMPFLGVAWMVTAENVAAVQIIGGPIGVLGATPTARSRPVMKDSVTETLLGVMSVATEMHVVTFPDENAEAFHNVRPELTNWGVQTGTGSGVVFRDHNEVAFAQGRPDVIGLCCLRGHPQAGTTVASVREALSLIPAEVDDLRMSEFRAGVPRSFLHGEGSAAFVDGIAVVYGPECAPMSRVNFAAMSVMPGASASAAYALPAFERALRQVERVYYLAPGSVLLINNRYAVHGRTAFEPDDFGVTARWLQRIYLRRVAPARHESPRVIGF